MGTRADFYVGRGKKAEWLGSVAWDGHPGTIGRNGVRPAKTEEEFRANVKAMFDERDDATRPEDGWPWPWDDSQTTDYAYAFDGGEVWCSCFGSEWFAAANEPKSYDGLKENAAVFPNMKSRQAVTMGRRSGVLVFGVK